MDLAPELFVGYVVGLTYVGLFILVSFIADVLDKRRK